MLETLPLLLLLTTHLVFRHGDGALLLCRLMLGGVILSASAFGLALEYQT